jgi:hypothetical protein
VDAAVGPWRLYVFRGVLGAPGQLSDEEPIDTVPNSIAGHTVVSSVYRGPADLTFGDGRVLFTAGFPAIGAVMNLTHGVHGIGDTTISVPADASVLPDIDTYTGLLDTALREVAAADGYA